MRRVKHFDVSYEAAGLFCGMIQDNQETRKFLKDHGVLPGDNISDFLLSVVRAMMQDDYAIIDCTNARRKKKGGGE